MAIVIRFVDKDDFIRERFFGLIHVSDTKALTLKNEIFSTLCRYDLDFHNIRGQGYDGASNMRGEWKGLQAIIANECPYAYYVHCFAHRLQLALVATSREVGICPLFAHRLLVLSSTLDPQNGHTSFSIDDICKLVDEFYPKDFTEHKKEDLRIQLQHYEFDVLQHQEFQKLSTISDLYQWLVKTRKSTIYPLIDRLIRLVLTLPVSTITTERAFSAMSHVKSELRYKMEDEYLTNSLIVYIEKEIAKKFSTESIIDGFCDLKERRVQF